MLLALCSAPLLFLRQLNDRYALLGLFMGRHFLFFGAADLQILLLGTEFEQPTRYGSHDAGGEVDPDGGGGCARRLPARGGPVETRSNPTHPGGVAGCLDRGGRIHAVGSWARCGFDYQIYVVPSKIGYEAAKGLSNMGSFLTLVVMACEMMLSVGALMLAYGYAKYGGLLWMLLTVGVVAVQVVGHSSRIIIRWPSWPRCWLS